MNLPRELLERMVAGGWYIGPFGPEPGAMPGVRVIADSAHATECRAAIAWLNAETAWLRAELHRRTGAHATQEALPLPTPATTCREPATAHTVPQGALF